MSSTAVLFLAVFVVCSVFVNARPRGYGPGQGPANRLMDVPVGRNKMEYTIPTPSCDAQKWVTPRQGLSKTLRDRSVPESLIVDVEHAVAARKQTVTETIENRQITAHLYRVATSPAAGGDASMISVKYNHCIATAEVTATAPYYRQLMYALDREGQQVAVPEGTFVGNRPRALQKEEEIQVLAALRQALLAAPRDEL